MNTQAIIQIQVDKLDEAVAALQQIVDALQP